MHQLAAPAYAEIEIKKSRFLGQLYSVNNRAEARSKLAEIRAQHPGAVHVCWVLICEGDSGLDDDGEPSGTAAKPMYNVLVHKEVTNVLAVVVRYWGGIKLGAGGLTRAYGQAVSEAFKTAQLKVVEQLHDCGYVVSFADESALRRLCEQLQIEVTSVDYADAVTLHLRIKKDVVELFDRQISDLLRGEVVKLLPEQDEN